MFVSSSVSARFIGQLNASRYIRALFIMWTLLLINVLCFAIATMTNCEGGFTD